MKTFICTNEYYNSGYFQIVWLKNFQIIIFWKIIWKPVFYIVLATTKCRKEISKKKRNKKDMIREGKTQNWKSDAFRLGRIDIIFNLKKNKK